MEKAVIIELLMLVACSLCWSVEHKCPVPCDCQHVQHILCSNRGLFTVPKSSHFISSIGTKTYSLGGNFISNISALDFMLFPQLQRLDLQYNQIGSIHPKAFEKLTQLEELYLGNNLLPTLSPVAFGHLEKLKVLNVNGNRLHNVTRTSFSSLVALIKLRLDNNDIHTLQGSPFSALYNLLYLHLENNKITNISKNAFAGLGKLRLLSLSGNLQNFLRQPTFLPLRSLSTLTMAGNHLQQLGPGVFNGLQKLSRLILSSNLLSVIHSKTFLGLGALQELHLDGNLLSHLPENLLVPLHNLEVLNLSRNSLSELHRGAFHGLNRLRVLDLQHNMLSFLPGETFSGNPALYRLQLDGNRWNCDCHLLEFKHWILGTLHSRSRMLTVFVQCWEPQEIAGKYLDYLEDAYLQGVGWCIFSTTPTEQDKVITSTLKYKDMVLHKPRKEARVKTIGSVVPSLKGQTKKDNEQLPQPTLPSGPSSSLEIFPSSQQALATKQPPSTKSDNASKHLGIETLQKGKSKNKHVSVDTLHVSSETLHQLPATDTVNHLHLMDSDVTVPTLNNMQPNSESMHSELPPILYPPSEIPSIDNLQFAFRTLHKEHDAGKINHDKTAMETLHQSHSDTMQPFQEGQTDLLQPAAETLHQVASFPSLLSDPCEFNKLYLLNLSVESVGSSTARVRWQTLKPHTRGPVLFRVLYERFGQAGRFQRFVYPRVHAESLTLQELAGDTPYLVCVESIIGGRACPVAPRDHCVGLVTLPSEDDRPLLNYQMLALALLAVNALLLLLGLVAWGSRLARRKWGRRRAPVHVRQMYSTRRPYRSVGTGVSTDFSGFQSHRPRTTVCALGEADLIEFPGCERFRESSNIHREDLLQRFTD
ncbi:TLR4 interactor with leucine rich repeats [Rhinophrynus dorsalis]